MSKKQVKIMVNCVSEPGQAVDYKGHFYIESNKFYCNRVAVTVPKIGLVRRLNFV